MGVNMNKPDIVDIIGEVVDLKKIGYSFKGLCPFHEEKTPSFIVNEDRQTYHCFGCGERGDVINFVMKLYELSFPDALKHLKITDGNVQIDPVVHKKRTERAIRRAEKRSLKDEAFNAELEIIDRIELNEDCIEIMRKHGFWTTYGMFLHKRSELANEYCNHTRS